MRLVTQVREGAGEDTCRGPNLELEWSVSQRAAESSQVVQDVYRPL